MGIARHFEVFSQYLVKMYRELEFPTLYLAFLHVHKSTWGVGCSQPQANTFSFPALSKEAERVLRDLPAQARPVSSCEGGRERQMNMLWKNSHDSTGRPARQDRVSVLIHVLSALDS